MTEIHQNRQNAAWKKKREKISQSENIEFAFRNLSICPNNNTLLSFHFFKKWYDEDAKMLFLNCEAFLKILGHITKFETNQSCTKFE